MISLIISTRLIVQITENLKMITLQWNIKKTDDRHVDSINKSDKDIANRLSIADRVDVMPKTEAYITLKDHKDDFQNKLPCRLINPNKCELRKVSKQILERINSQLRIKLKYNQWRKTKDVINWFGEIEDKGRTSFIQADIDAFYPNISEELLNNAIRFAKSYVTIPDEEIDIIKKTKQNLLFSDGKPWSKRGNSECDVTMGSWDGAEVCELCGLYLLSQVQHLNLNIGMYRDDILGATKQRPQQAERTKQQLRKIFKDNGLDIKAETNIKTVNFLDVTFNLNDGEYMPYMKPNNTLVYVHSQSNHPPATLKKRSNQHRKKIVRIVIQ